MCYSSETTCGIWTGKRDAVSIFSASLTVQPPNFLSSSQPFASCRVTNSNPAIARTRRRNQQNSNHPTNYTRTSTPPPIHPPLFLDPNTGNSHPKPPSCTLPLASVHRQLRFQTTIAVPPLSTRETTYHPINKPHERTENTSESPDKHPAHPFTRPDPSINSTRPE